MVISGCQFLYEQLRIRHRDLLHTLTGATSLQLVDNTFHNAIIIVFLIVRSGKSCTLKETESEPESDIEAMNGRPRRYYSGRKGRMGGPRRSQINGANHSEGEHLEVKLLLIFHEL